MLTKPPPTGQSLTTHTPLQLFLHSGSCRGKGNRCEYTAHQTVVHIAAMLSDAFLLTFSGFPESVRSTAMRMLAWQHQRHGPHYESQLALVGVGSRWFALVWRWSWPARRWAPTPIWQQALKHILMLIHQ
jgi:hypothetical protein